MEFVIGGTQMNDDELKQYICEKTKSNIHYENNERVLELSLEGLQDFFEVIDVIISK